MTGNVKKIIQDTLVSIETAKFMKEYEQQKGYTSYAGWLYYDDTKKKDNLKDFKTDRIKVKTICFDELKNKLSFKDISEDVLVFYSANGVCDSEITAHFAKCFMENPKLKVCYADEDELKAGESGEKERNNPWIKPIWSEDTLLSFQYFGNIFAVRTNHLRDLVITDTDDTNVAVYDLVLKACRGCNKDEVLKLDLILFSKTDDENRFWGYEEKYNRIKNDYIKSLGLEGEMVLNTETGFSYPVYDVQDNPKVSIVIPSKDNPDVLMRCISTVQEYTEYKNYEIIVVDNGSNDENRKRLEELSNKCNFKYFYEKMDFNFSIMCNLGVSKSCGEYILLLNDDMEVVDGSWLTRMLGQATLKNTGAVGAKLLYPNTTLIQHAGVANSVDGPTHKLVKMDDSITYFYGRNKLVYDMIGVTAACLLVSKKKYLEVEGLFEGLKVAFNDVDFCFKLYEAGYNNVQRNDAVLYHHESLSRGNDLMDDNKIKRLLAERSVLYARHPDLKRVDPYLGDIFNGGYPEFRMSSANDKIFYNYGEPKKRKALPDENTMNKMVFPTIEACKKEKDYYVIKGFAYMPTLDNARFKRKLLFVDKNNTVYEVKANRFYREDTARGLKEVIHPELNGFCVRIKEGLLPSGEYEVWMYAKDTCSRQSLYSKTEDVLIVE